MVPLESSLTTALFLIYFALLAKSRVESVSPTLIKDGETFAIITVLLFPPRESLKMKVSLLSLYGMCLTLPSVCSTRELITFPRADSDLLIIPASLSRSPTAFVFFERSDPARSMMWKREVLTFQTPDDDMDLLSIIVVNTE